MDQKFTDYEEVFQSAEKGSTFTHVSMDGKDRMFDPRQYRPLHIKLNVTLHDIQAHLVKVQESNVSRFCAKGPFQLRTEKLFLAKKLAVLVLSCVRFCGRLPSMLSKGQRQNLLFLGSALEVSRIC